MNNPRLRFECVTRDAERGPECQTDRERVRVTILFALPPALMP